ncbi:LysR family transcriptional regulator [Paraburkholderia caledonica]|uniref:LysR family transcriptional regulator n=1 Tax=Paraburkholderia caledonica TaxID=134536 RepID=UPI0038BBFEAA
MLEVFGPPANGCGCPPSTVSERIAHLEAQLGVPLLIRTTRSVMPTETGRTLATRVAPLMAETRAALCDAASSQNLVRGLLKLNVTGAVMVDILLPIIDRFMEAHPQVRVEIMVDDQLVDIVAAGCDAGIRFGEHLALDTMAFANWARSPADGVGGCSRLPGRSRCSRTPERLAEPRMHPVAFSERRPCRVVI